MAEYKTIRVPKDVYEDAKQRKDEWDVTWGEYVSPHAWHSVFDAPNDAKEDSELTIDVMVDASEAKDELEELQAMAQQTKDEIDSLAFNGQVSEDTAKRIMNRIDDLESQLPRKVAEEVRNQ